MLCSRYLEGMYLLLVGISRDSPLQFKAAGPPEGLFPSAVLQDCLFIRSIVLALEENYVSIVFVDLSVCI